MEKTIIAKLILVQLEALNQGDFEGRSIEQYGLLNEILRSTYQLAEETLTKDATINIIDDKVA